MPERGRAAAPRSRAGPSRARWCRSPSAPVACHWPNLAANVTGWRDFVAAARASGIRNIPDPIGSIGAPLTRPASGDLDATVPNQSEGAQLIVDLSLRLSRSYRPLVVVAGGRLTDVADAYLIDHTSDTCLIGEQSHPR